MLLIKDMLSHELEIGWIDQRKTKNIIIKRSMVSNSSDYNKALIALNSESPDLKELYPLLMLFMQKHSLI